MPEVIITYETLYELLRKEKIRTELQNLDPEFFKHVVTYLNDKEAILQSQSKKDIPWIEKSKVFLIRHVDVCLCF